MSTGSHLSEEQVRRLRDAIEPFLGTPLATAGRWRSMGDDELWLRVVCQVAVIGGAAGGSRVFEDKKAWKSLAWKHVVTMSDSEARAAISTVLRQAGVRYVGADPAKDRKSAALVHNLRVLERAGGPRKYFRALARKKTDLERVTALCRELKSIKHKSARDLLIEIGMDQDFIAFDSRVQKVLKALGIEDASFSDAARYRELEEMFLAAVPALGVTCLGHLDRVLFHNTDAILSRLGFGTPPTGTVTIALSEETRAKLERVARKRGVALHDLARQLLESAIGSLRQ